MIFMFNDFIDWIMTFIGILFIGLLLFLFSMFCFVRYAEFQKVKCCKRYERIVVYQESFTEWMPSGKVLIPVYHQAGNYEKRVCVEPRDNCK